jgi:photosystem II stability/assembly factor-like uncharacterized protein
MKKIITLILLVFSSLISSAQWLQLENNITNVTAFASDSTKIFAAAIGFVYYSQDNGDSFTSISTGLPSDMDVNEILIKESNIYLATNIGLYHSSNNGQQWNLIGNGLPSTYIYSITSLNEKIFVGMGDGVYQSTDQGQNWSLAGLLSFASPTQFIFSIKSVGNKIFASRYADRTYVSNDEGITWTQSGNGLELFAFGVDIEGAGNRVFQVLSAYGGVYSSSNSGNSWVSYNNEVVNTDFRKLAFDGVNLFAAGEDIYYSTNFAQNWILINENLPTNGNIGDLLIYDGFIYAAVPNSGIWRRSITNIISSENNVLNRNFSFFPNPTNDFITIDFNSSNQKNNSIKIFDTMGKIVFSENNVSANSKYNVEFLNKGIYILEIQSEDLRMQKKLLKY